MSGNRGHVFGVPAYIRVSCGVREGEARERCLRRDVSCDEYWDDDEQLGLRP